MIYLLLIPAITITVSIYQIFMETPDYLLIIERSEEKYKSMMKKMAAINKSQIKKYRKVFGKHGKYNKFQELHRMEE